MSTTEHGVIKKLVREKGFGFIASNGAGPELFFHKTAIRNLTFEELQEGQRVSFEIGRGSKGPRAENVVVNV